LLGKLKGNDKGGIEGLPLQLMIVIMVATMGSAVIMGWMGNIDTPSYISSLNVGENIVYIEDGEIPDIHVCVLDEDGEPMGGVTLRIVNSQVYHPEGKEHDVVTGSDGRATLRGWLLGDYPMRTIALKISAYKSGYDTYTEEVPGVIV
jgi:hypothetical protein